MPKFSAEDQLEIIRNLKEAGVDIYREPLHEYVNKLNEFTYTMGVDPVEERDDGVVDSVEHDQQSQQFFRRYKNGTVEVIPPEVYQNEVMYNFLPLRFKSYKPRQ
jgi:hypothetical protein